MAYSADLRALVLRKYDSGQQTQQIARELQVSKAWCRRVKQRRDQPPTKVGGSKPKLDAHARGQLKGWIEQRPDATLEELRARVKAELGIAVSIGCLWGTVRALEFTYKKSH
jgi:transposase